MRIAVIGAGVAGLTAAYDLSKQGHEVTVFEAGPHPGGLAGSFLLGGVPLERTYHHLFTTDRDIQALCTDLGIGDRLLWRQASMGMLHSGSFHPFSTPLDLLRFRPLRCINRIRLGVALFYLQHVRRWQRLIAVSAMDWMRRYAGRQALEVIWKPLLEGKFHRHAPDVSMAWLWARIHTRGGSSRNVGKGNTLGYFDGGFQCFIDTLASALEKQGCAIRTASPISALSKDAAGKPVITLLSGEAVVFDAVIATTPSHVFSKLIGGHPDAPDSYRLSLSSIEYLGAMCAVFSSTQSLLPYYWVNLTDPGCPFLVLIEHTKFIDPATYGGRHVYYIGAYVPHDHRFFTNTPEAVWAEAVEWMQKNIPGFHPGEVQEHHVFRLANAQHVVDTRYAEKIPAVRTPLPFVYLTNFSQIFPHDRGTNYAVKQGREVAEMVMGDFK